MELTQNIKHLKILSENELGFGILVENDAGLISPEFELNAPLIREAKEGLVDYTQPIIRYATLQKYDVENRNGRIYPEDILRRESDRYQKIINMNASYQELDHPECQRATAEILTSNRGITENSPVINPGIFPNLLIRAGTTLNSSEPQILSSLIV
jgi:hypothetical protein